MVLSSNPFALFRTELVTQDELLKYFAAPPHLEMLRKAQPVILKGGRGTGKTMLLRYLSLETQQAEFLQKNDMRNWTPELAKRFWEQLEFFGVYLRLSGCDTTAFKENRMSVAEWTSIFLHYFNMSLCSRILDLVLASCKLGLLTIGPDASEQICDRSIKVVLNRSGELKNLEELQDLFDMQRRSVERFLRERSFKDIPYQGELSGLHEPIVSFVKVLRMHVPEIASKPFFLLLDEYENLLEPQQRLINSMVKLSSESLSFKVSTRHYGFVTNDTLIGNEKLEVPHDYQEVSIEQDLFENPEQYEKLLREISRRRLLSSPEFLAAGITEVNQVFPSVSDEDEARALVSDDAGIPHHVRKFKRFLVRTGIDPEQAEQWIKKLTGQNPLLDKFNHVLVSRGRPLPDVYKGYSAYLEGKKDGWYGKVFEPLRKAILFLLIRDYGRRHKLYCGFPTFAKLSSGVIRSYLQLCEKAVYYAQLDGADILADGVSPNFQTKAAERVADSFFTEILDIAPQGGSMQSFARELGSIFRQMHLDSTLRSPEVTFFSTYTDQLSLETGGVLKASIKHSLIFKKKSMNTKEIDRPVPEDYVLNRILAPKFGISTTMRNRISMSPRQLSDLMFGTPEVRSRTKHEITKRRNDPPENQITFGFVDPDDEE